MDGDFAMLVEVLQIPLLLLCVRRKCSWIVGVERLCFPIILGLQVPCGESGGQSIEPNNIRSCESCIAMALLVVCYWLRCVLKRQTWLSCERESIIVSYFFRFVVYAAGCLLLVYCL